MLFKQRAENLDVVSHYLRRASTIPNALVFLVPKVESGKTRKRFVARPLSATRKVGGFIFTKKPFVFPSRKTRRVK